MGIKSGLQSELRSPGLLTILVLCGILVSPSLFAFAAVLQGGPDSEDDRLVARIADGNLPYFVAEPKDPTQATYNVTVNFTALVKDIDNDPLKVTWEWGDGTVNVSTTAPAGTQQVIRRGHAFTPDREQGRGWIYFPYIEFFNLTIYLDDGNGNNVSCRTQVNVTMPINGLPVTPTIRLNGTSSTLIDPTQTVYVVANSSDPEGESLTWTYIFKNDIGEIYRTVVLNTPATEKNGSAWANVSHEFGSVGQHRIEVYVSDALWPYQEFPHNITSAIEATVVINLPPTAASINVNPNVPVVNATRGYTFVNYSLEASDVDRDPFTVTWNFDDGTPEVVNYSANGLQTIFRQMRMYTEAGSFNVTVVISDGRPGHELYLYKIVNVSSTNLPPVLRKFQPVNLSGGSWAQPNETIQFEIVISDPELNEVEVTIDWGDGSEILHFFLSEFVGTNVTIWVNHTYTTKGNFTILLNYTDNKIGSLNHNKNYTLTMETRIVYVTPPERWSWWDYTTLAVVGLVPVVIVMWMFRASRHRRMIESEGLSMDEWKLLQDKTVLEAIEQEKKR